MQVILSAVQRQGNASEVSNCSADVVIKTHFVIGSYQWAAIFRRKDYVVEEISVRVPHDSAITGVHARFLSRAVGRFAGYTESLGAGSRGSLALTPGFMLSAASRTSDFRTSRRKATFWRARPRFDYNLRALVWIIARHTRTRLVRLFPTGGDYVKDQVPYPLCRRS